MTGNDSFWNPNANNKMSWIIDSCMREESRTKMILDAAREVLSARYNIETIDVNLLALSPVTPEVLKVRETAELARRIAGAF